MTSDRSPIVCRLPRYLNRTASHPSLLTDPDFKEFLEKDTELPRSTNTSAFSGAGVMRLLHKVGDTIEKMAFKMDEIDEVTMFLSGKIFLCSCVKMSADDSPVSDASLVIDR